MFLIQTEHARISSDCFCPFSAGNTVEIPVSSMYRALFFRIPSATFTFNYYVTDVLTSASLNMQIAAHRFSYRTTTFMV
jgi:hypothetical protein